MATIELKISGDKEVPEELRGAIAKAVSKAVADFMNGDDDEAEDADFLETMNEIGLTIATEALFTLPNAAQLIDDAVTKLIKKDAMLQDGAPAEAKAYHDKLIQSAGKALKTLMSVSGYKGDELTKALTALSGIDATKIH